MTESIKRRLPRSKYRQKQRDKEIGKRYGRLVIQNITYDDFRTYAHCMCDCGNHYDTRLDHLRTHHTYSCGCYRKEVLRIAPKPGLQKSLVEGTDLCKLGDHPRSTNRTSGLRNVYWVQKVNKWKVVITFKRKVYYLGQFDDIQIANKVAQQFRDEHFKEIKEKYQQKGTKQ